jgi:hypothetical protein
VKDADDGSISGEYTETNRCDHGSEQNEGHNQRIHGNQPLTKGCYQMRGTEIRIPSFFCVGSVKLQRSFNLTALTLRSVDD